jgi:hypothetical protein
MVVGRLSDRRRPPHLYRWRFRARLPWGCGVDAAAAMVIGNGWRRRRNDTRGASGIRVGG